MSNKPIRPSDNPSINDEIQPNNSRHTTKEGVRWIDTTADYTPLSPCGGMAPPSLNIRHLTAPQPDRKSLFLQRFEFRLVRCPACHLGRGHTILTSRELMWCYARSLGCERRFNIEFYGADSHFCHSAYVTWSHVELWSAHAPARLSHFCCRTHFVRRDQRVECLRTLDKSYFIPTSH